MLKRLIVNDLERWRDSTTRKPLVLRGARQVGKTFAVRMFGATYDCFSELNLELEENRILFEQRLSPRDVLQAMKLKYHVPAQVRSWLLFLDEIQACPAAVAMLRYFYEQIPELHVIAAGSLLEAALQRERISFPVGRVEFRYLYPLNFEEFLDATGGAAMVEAFHQVPTPPHAQNELFSQYHRYALVGGMPEAVAQYVTSNDMVTVNHVYENLVTAYLDDIPKYARNETMAGVLRHVLKYAPLVAGKRVTFAGFGESDYGSREIGDALRTLEQVMLLSLMYPTTAVHAPWAPNTRKSPRLQFVDTGMIHYVSGIQRDLLGVADLSAGFRGGLVEQVTGQELMASRRDTRNIPLFWVRDKTQSQAELDFLEVRGDVPLPVEVKAGGAGKLRSLNCFMEMVPRAQTAVRLYRGPFFVQEAGSKKRFRLLNVPYYHASKMHSYDL